MIYGCVVMSNLAKNMAVVMGISLVTVDIGL